jgi:hypothetical protein
MSWIEEGIEVDWIFQIACFNPLKLIDELD